MNPEIEMDLIEAAVEAGEEHTIPVDMIARLTEQGYDPSALLG